MSVKHKNLLQSYKKQKKKKMGKGYELSTHQLRTLYSW